jgi:hypothetical protein
LKKMRKRSKYRPKGVRLDTMAYIKVGMMSFKEVSDAVDLRIKNHLAMESLRLGKATTADIDILIAAFNIVEGLCRLRKDFGKDWSNEIREGQDALLVMSRRGVAAGRFVCKASELVAMNLVMEIHDAQLDSVTVKDLEMAMNVVQEDFRNKRMRAIKQRSA